MTETDLVNELHRLGVDEDGLHVITLLPLVEVAWADGDVHAREHAVILSYAEERVGLGAEHLRVLEDWLEHQPSDTYFERGRRALVAAVSLGRITLDGWTLDEAVEQSREVAKAAGGLLGFGTIDANEQAALESLADEFGKHTGTNWNFDDLAGEAFEDEPPTSEMLVISGSHNVGRGDADPGKAREAELVLLDDTDEPIWVIDQEITVGRSRRNHVWIQTDSQISRFHFRIFQEHARWYLEDRSTHGTRVLGERTSFRRLFGGEDIEVGGTTFRFQLP